MATISSRTVSQDESDERYSDVAIALHWLLAVALVVVFAVGVYMADLKLSPTRIRLFNWHKWVGISLLVLSALRFGWRLTHRAPELPASVADWQRRATAAVHGLMYALFFAVPVVGWAMSSAKGFPVVWFGLIPLPDFVPVDKALGETLEDVHAFLAYTLSALVAVHIGAALHHRFVLRDAIVNRMLPMHARQRGGVAG